MASDKVRKRVLQQIQRWREELVDLTRNNRLLYFRHTKTRTLEIESPQSTQVVEGLHGSGWRFYFPSDDDTDDADPAPSDGELVTQKRSAQELHRALRILDRRTSEEFMDKGLWVLYLGFGMLHWTDPEHEESAESPLLLIPVTLERESPRDPYTLRSVDEDTVVNPALAVKLETDFGIGLPRLEEIDLAEPDSALGRFRSIFAQKPDWTVHPRLILGTFSFFKEVMFEDLKEHAETIADHELIQAIALGPDADVDLDFPLVPESDLDALRPPERSVVVQPADASQRQAIAAANDGHSFVMDGPPGTGKSQTITNIIAELLAQEKRVLFVSEKAAALEVVRNRLKDVGLDEYALELHSHKATRKEVAQELGHAVETRPVPSASLSNEDLERLIQRRTALSDYAIALNERREPLGHSLHQVLGRIAELQHLPQAPPPSTIDSSLRPGLLANLQDWGAALSRAWKPVEAGESFLWRDVSDPSYDATRLYEIESGLESATDALKALQDTCVDIDASLGLGLDASPRDAENLLHILEILDGRPPVPVHWLTGHHLDHVEGRIEQLSELANTYHRSLDELTEVVGDGWEGLDVTGFDQLRAEEEQLAVTQSAFLLSGSEDALAIRERARNLETTADCLADIHTHSVEIGTRFGLDVEGLRLGRAREIGHLGKLADADLRPEEEWINPSTFNTVRKAYKVLGSHAIKYRGKRDQLADVFTDSILRLDLHSLCVRFDTVHPGIGKFKKQYRDDKQLIAACTRSGKADKKVREHLRDALEWKRVAERLRSAESKYASVLGRYYEGEGTDFAAAKEAILVAREALKLTGSELDQQAVRAQLGADAEPDPEVPLGAAEIERAASKLGATLGGLPEESAALIEELSLVDAVERCRRAASSLRTVAEVVADVDRHSPGDSVLDTASDLLDWRRSIHLAREEFESHLEDDQELLGALYDGSGTDWDRFRDAVSWTQRLRETLGEPPMASVAEQLLSTNLTAEPLRERVTQWQKARDSVASYFRDPRKDAVAAQLERGFSGVSQFLEALRGSVEDIHEWAAFSEARGNLEQSGLEGAVAFCIDQEVPRDQVPGIIERAVLERWADTVLKDDDRLGIIRSVDRDSLQEDFRRLDKELVNQAAGRVIERCNAKRPRSTAGAVGTLLSEARKKRRHMPVRRLLERTAPAVQALKPCFMMSPLTVSQFLPQKVRFDAIIFDEASQVRPSDAINCLYRGSQLIVAGDEKQLPPSAFFQKSVADNGDEWEEDQLEEFESILDNCKRGSLRSIPLRWHYRSQHEALITYSNYRFYDGRLITFPGAIDTASDVGVELFHVPDGEYRRGATRDNPREAEEVVKRVLYHAREHPDLSLGVVAFSEAQQTTIENLIERTRLESPDLDPYFREDRLDGFFVKNLENVQGDERHIILFSVGYGPDENGKFTLNLGPLTQRSGPRRLNVAITRAKRRVEIVSSITAADFPADMRSEGARHLKRYLDFARRGSEALAVPLEDSEGDVESPFEAEVLRVIQSWGYDAVPQVGAAGYRIDIGIRHESVPGAYALGIECDGRMYHSAKTARDRDRLRQDVLEGLGWQLHRIWGPAWYRNRQTEEARLKAAIEEGLAKPPRSQALRRSERIPKEGEAHGEGRSVAYVDLNESPDWATPYVVSQPTPSRRSFEMHEGAARPTLRRMTLEVVKQEAPVSRELVLRRVREAWGVQRAGERIRDAFNSVVSKLDDEGELDVDGDFLLLSGHGPSVVRCPDPEDPPTQRQVADVYKGELRLAVKNTIRDAHVIDRDELSLEVARLFGWRRRGPDIVDAVEEAIGTLLEGGAIKSRSDGRLTLTD